YQGLFKERAEHFSDDEFTFLPKRLSPNVKGCMVDLYGRAGQLDKALEIIHVSSCHEDPVLWGTLLGSCKIIRRNLELEERSKRSETPQPSPQHEPNMQSSSSSTASSSLAYPPGYRFVPTDAEIIYYYLKPFSPDNKKSWPNLPIHHANIYESNPQQLTAEYKKGNLTEWFFISERTKIKTNGQKQKRVDHNGGYWHSKAVTKKIKVKKDVVGYKTTLNYFVGKQPNGERTNWLMQEYWLESSGHNNTVDYALCKIYLSPTAQKNMKEEDVEEVEEEAVQPRTVEIQQPQPPQFYPTPLVSHQPQPLPQFWPTELDSYQPQSQDNEYQEPLQAQPLNTIYQHQSQCPNNESEYQEPHQPQPLNTIYQHQSQRHNTESQYQEPHQPQPLDTIDHHQPQCHDSAYQNPPQPQPLDTIHYHQSQLHDIDYQEPHQPQPLDSIDHHQPQCHDSAYQNPPQPQPLDTIHYHQSQLHDIEYQEPHQPQSLDSIDHHQPQCHDSAYQNPPQPQPLDTIHYHQSQLHDIEYQEPHQSQPFDNIIHHQSHQVQFWQATSGSHQRQLQDQLPQSWAAPLDSYPPRCHDIQYPQPQPLDAIEYQYLYQSGPLTTYKNVIESCTQDKSNGDIKKVDHALKIHLTPRGIKREVEEEEDEKRKRKKKEGGVEAPKEELEQLINSHQNSSDNDSFFTGFVDTHLLHIDIESSISNCCLKKSPDEN
ncbi:hypothetical protein IGI04_014412, partial [Brassica rapa subsp. trilocularis]